MESKMFREAKQGLVDQLNAALDRDMSKAEVLEKILKDEARGMRILPAPGYSHKMQTIRSNKVNA